MSNEKKTTHLACATRSSAAAIILAVIGMCVGIGLRYLIQPPFAIYMPVWLWYACPIAFTAILAVFFYRCCRQP